MKLSSRLILAFAVLFHLALLAGWRWQYPLVPYFFDATVLSGGRGLDFYAVYQAGYNARHGQDIYENDPAKINVVVPYFTPYRYLPPVAYTLGAALSLTSPLTAYKLWLVITELTLWLCLALTFHYARNHDHFARLACMWLCFTPYYLELFMGQFSLVQGAFIFGMLLAADSRPVMNTACCRLALSMPFLIRLQKRIKPEILLDGLWITSILWKINTIICAPVFLRLRRFRTLAILAILGALATIPYFAIFPAHLTDFLKNNFGGQVSGYELGNLGFRQLVFEILDRAGIVPPVQHMIQLAIMALFIGAALFLTFWPHHEATISPNGTARSPAASSTATRLSLWLTVFFLISPQIWEHHYVMLLPVLAAAYLQRPGWAPVIIWLMLALPTPFGFCGLQPLIAANHNLRATALEPAWAALFQHASKAIPTLALFIYLAGQIVMPKICDAQK